MCVTTAGVLFGRLGLAACYLLFVVLLLMKQLPRATKNRPPPEVAMLASGTALTRQTPPAFTELSPIVREWADNFLGESVERCRKIISGA